jgi:PKD repeat protein
MYKLKYTTFVSFHKLAFSFLFIFLSINLFAQITVLTEDFESSASIPSNWSQQAVQGTSVWSINNGGTLDLGSHHPSSAHGGIRNAYISSQSTSGNIRKLVSPSMDMSGLGAISLEFWEARLQWGTDKDYLKVYYKTSSSGNWVLLQSYTTATTGWVKRTISLPNPSSTYYIAFEGIPKYGYGVCIDDVKITASIAVDVSMTQIEVVNKEVVKASFKNLGANNLTSCTFNFIVDGGSTVYTNTWSGNIATNASGLIYIDTFAFSHGLHNIKCYASNPNNTGDGDRTNDTIYQDYMIIKNFPYAESFENSDIGYWKQSTTDDINWIRQNVRTLSTGTGPNAAYDGSYFMYIESSGNYNKTATLLTPDMEISPLTNPYLEVMYHLYGNQMGSLHFDIDSVSTWIQSIDTSIVGNQGNAWYKKRIRLKDYKDLNKIGIRGITGNGFLSDIAIDDVRLIDLPFVDLGPDTIICQGENIRFSADTGNSYSFYWTAMGYSDTISYQNSITVDSSGTYILCIEGAYGYTAIDSVMLTVAPLPEPGFIAQTNSYCFNEHMFSFTDTSLISSGSFSYFWQFGDHDTSTQQNPVHRYASADTFLVKLILTSNYYCMDSTDYQIIVHPSPAAAFSVNDSSQCLRNNYFQFTDLSTINSGSISGYHWTFGDTNTSILNTPMHQYTRADTFLSQLIVQSDMGCTDTTTQTMYTFPMPVASFSINDSTQCLYDNSFQFTDLSTIPVGQISSHWNMGDNYFTTQQNPSHSYLHPAHYRVQLVSTSSLGCSDTLEQGISVYAMPEAIILLSTANTQCYNNHLFSMADQSNAKEGFIASRSWQLGDGNMDTAKNVQQQYADFGTYNLRLVVENSIGCYDTSYQQLKVFPNPLAAFTFNKSGQCLDANNFLFSNASTIDSGNMHYEWIFGDGQSDNLTNPDHQYTQAGTYQVMLKAISDEFCEDSSLQTIEVFEEPTADFSVNTNEQCLSGNLFTFTNLSSINSGSFSSSWDFGDTTSSSDMNPVKTFATSASFNVELIVTSGNQCKDTIEKTVHVSPMPLVSFEINDSHQCLNENLFIFTDTSNTESGTKNRTWYFGNGQQGSDSVMFYTYPNSGKYDVKLVLRNHFDCIDSAIQNVELYPTPYVFLGEDTSIYDTSTLILDAGNGFEKYLWQDSSKQQTYEVISSSLGIGDFMFSVEVEDSNACRNSDTIKVSITKSGYINDPNNTILLKVYPNPASEKLYLVSDQSISLPMELTIFSMEGKRIVSKAYGVKDVKLKQEIDVSELKKGYYLVRILYGSTRQSFKILIN